MNLLSSTISDNQLNEFISNSDRDRIAEFILQRFSERYFEPIEHLQADEKHGFSVMAICCLVIESFESYKTGWKDTRNRSEAAFKQFFERENRFESIRTHSNQFYRHVRCGILHQSETTGGWKILRKGELFNSETKNLNATKFLKEVKEVIKEYCEHLKNDNWDSEDWNNLRRKLRSIIKNCQS